MPRSSPAWPPATSGRSASSSAAMGRGCARSRGAYRRQRRRRRRHRPGDLLGRLAQRLAVDAGRDRLQGLSHPDRGQPGDRRRAAPPASRASSASKRPPTPSSRRRPPRARWERATSSPRSSTTSPPCRPGSGRAWTCCFPPAASAPTGEIADALGLSEGAAEQLLVRARRTLRTRLTEQGSQGEAGMNRQEFEAALDRHGGDLSRWPGGLAEAAARLVAADGDAARRLAEARRLASRPARGDPSAGGVIEPALVGRIVAGAQGRTARQRPSASADACGSRRSLRWRWRRR